MRSPRSFPPQRRGKRGMRSIIGLASTEVPGGTGNASSLSLRWCRGNSVAVVFPLPETLLFRNHDPIRRIGNPEDCVYLTVSRPEVLLPLGYLPAGTPSAHSGSRTNEEWFPVSGASGHGTKSRKTSDSRLRSLTFHSFFNILKSYFDTSPIAGQWSSTCQRSISWSAPVGGKLPGRARPRPWVPALRSAVFVRVFTRPPRRSRIRPSGKWPVSA